MRFDTIACGIPLSSVWPINSAPARSCPRFGKSIWIGGLFAVAVSLSPTSLSFAQSPAVVDQGNGVVSGFSGFKTSSKVPADAHPLDVTFIDTNAASLRVLNLSELGGPPEGQILNATTKMSVKAKQIGQVFGVALDDPEDGVAPNIFAAATSFYGLQIVGTKDGKPIRLVNGAPGARWMAGQFGTENGGGPGTIWKIDGKTGDVSLFTTLKSGPNDNAGPGLGALAYDPVAQILYAPNLETGFIHRIDMEGKDLGVFDHGTLGRLKAGLKAIAYDPSKRMSIEDPAFRIESPATWGYADKKRLVVAVAVENNRLYYSVAEGPQVWSVGLDTVGGFIGDARLEFDLADAPADNMITAIAFKGPKEVYVTQRGELAGSYDYKTFAHSNKSAVIRFIWNEEDERWSKDSEEFAVGMSKPHRATNGGLALGYGYDESGKLKTSSCGATLWKTGDHLRTGKDSGSVSGLQGASVSSGQARSNWRPSSGSSALQGDFQFADMTVLDPPGKSWFIDIDGQTKDTDAFGHIGALAVFAPFCDDGDAQSIRPEPLDISQPEVSWPGPGGIYPEWPPGGIPPIGVPGLDIKKSCAPGAFGGVIKCTITVENTGTLFFVHPITVSDATTIASGPGAGGALNVAAVTPDGAEWTCTPTPTINLSCGIPAAALPPGVSRSFTVDIDTSGMIADGNVGFSNCASLGAPYWGIACDNAGADITVKKTAQAGCNAGANCTFGLEITNNASTPFNGQVQLTDEMFRGAVGPALNAPIVAISADLGCAGGNPAALPFSCQAAMTLAAGETRSLDMTVTMPAVPANYWARNCFAATSPGLIPGDLSTMMPPGGGSLGTGGAVSCAWMQVGAPGLHSNLKMQKTAKACGKLPGDPNTVNCDYTISISNSGPTDFNNAISFDETVDPNATLISTDPTWACAGGPPTYACNSAGAVSIASGATIEIPVSITTPRAVVEANACVVPNTVALTTPPVNLATNYFGADDAASADGDAFLLEFDVGGAAIILCDPTNLKTTNVSKGPCEKIEPGWQCEFAVEVENTGPDPYKGEIKLLDISSIAPTSVTYTGTPGWSRTPAIGHDLYTLPKRTLPKGDSVKLNLTVNIPDGPHCTLANTAHMTFPVLERHNGDKTDDTAIATAMIPRPECKKPPQCLPKRGEMITVSGACACEPNSSRAKNGVCEPRPDIADPTPPAEPDPPVTVSLCPDGYPIPRNGVCPCPDGQIWDTGAKTCIGDDDDLPDNIVPIDVTDPDPPKLCKLLPGQIRASNNRCICPNGRKWNAKTHCKPKPCKLLPGQIRTSDNRCICANGRRWNRKTYCEPKRPPCKPRPGEIIIKGKCGCANGRIWNAKTFCEPPPAACPQSGMYEAAPGLCCRIGQVVKNGKCWTPPPPCAKPRFINKQGRCTCGRNKVYNARKNTCEDSGPSGPTITCAGGRPVLTNATGQWVCKCPAGKRPVKASRTHYRCVPTIDPASACKLKGWHWTGKRCVRPPDPAKDCKKKGWRWTGKRCVPPPDPANDCKKKGWRWTGKRCVPPPNPARDCKAKGWRWTGKRCLPPPNPARDCKAKGWRWTGKRCLPPPNPARDCKAKGWRWTGKRCLPPRKPCPKGTVGPGQPNCKKVQLKKPKILKKPLKKIQPSKKINMRRLQTQRRVN